MKRLRLVPLSFAICFGFCGCAVAPVATKVAPPNEIVVHGGDERSFSFPSEPSAIGAYEAKSFDVVIVGGGVSSLTAALYLTDQKKSVLILEKERNLGGPAVGGVFGKSGMPYGRGAAYFTEPFEEERKILERIGFGNFKEKNKIPAPVDSYRINGQVRVGIWENPKVLDELPASFALFKHELQKADKEELVPNQPIEDAPHLDLDEITAADWVRQMPDRAALRMGRHSRALYHRFITDRRIDASDPMKEVVEIVDLYCRSALGAKADRVSALAFANFYLAELAPRYTTGIGNAGLAEGIGHQLRERAGPLFDVHISSTVMKIDQTSDSVVTTYFRNGSAFQVKSKYVIFAAQLKFAPKIITGLAQADPKRVAAINGLEFKSYAVHGVLLKGRPYRDAFDTWVKSSPESRNEFTDFLIGNWMDPEFQKGAESEGHEIITIYHLLSVDQARLGMSVERSRELANRDVSKLREVIPGMQVEAVETTRWPYSIHLVRPGHFTHTAALLKKPFGRVYFAHSSIGTPAVEEAFFRGHCAANNILAAMNPEFKQESWTKCKVEKPASLSH